MVLFERSNIASYYPSIATTSLSCTISERQQDTGQKSPILPTILGWPHQDFKILGVRKLESMDCISCDKSSHFDRTPIYGRLTDREIRGHSIYHAIAQ